MPWTFDKFRPLRRCKKRPALMLRDILQQRQQTAPFLSTCPHVDGEALVPCENFSAVALSRLQALNEAYSRHLRMAISARFLHDDKHHPCISMMMER